MEITEKKCSRCHTTKPIVEFHKSKKESCGFHSRCKACRRLDRLDYYYKTEQRRQSRIDTRIYYGFLLLFNQKTCRNRKQKREKKKTPPIRIRQKYSGLNNQIYFGFLLLFNQRYCYSCKQTFDVSEVYYNNANKTILCYPCKRQKNKKYKDAHRENVRKKDIEYRNSDHGKQKTKEWTQSFRGKTLIKIAQHKRRDMAEMVDNSLTAEQWKIILENQNNKCNLCGCKFTKKNVPEQDHIIPLSRGGGLNFENTQALCNSCNSRKHANLDKGNILVWSDIIYLDDGTPVTHSELKVLADLEII